MLTIIATILTFPFAMYFEGPSFLSARGLQVLANSAHHHKGDGDRGIVVLLACTSISTRHEHEHECE